MESQLTSEMRASGVRRSFPRMAVLRFLSAHTDRLMSPDEIHQALAATGSGLALSTIYQSVKALESAGLLIRESRPRLNGGTALYVMPPARSTANAGTLVCVICRTCQACSFIEEAGILVCLRESPLINKADDHSDHISVFVTCAACSPGCTGPGPGSRKRRRRISPDDRAAHPLPRNPPLLSSPE